LRAKGRFYEAFETPTELDLKRKKQLNMGLPPVYDRAALNLSEARRKNCAPSAVRVSGASSWIGSGSSGRRHPRRSVDRCGQRLGPGADPRGWAGLYTLASVVDDMDMGITHVVRGSDHVTNTATQIQIIQALGGTPPAFAHHSLLTGPAGRGAVEAPGHAVLRDLRAAGVEPMALLSLMARIGSSQPVVLAGSLDALAEGFDLSHFGAAPTKFDEADLWPLTANVLQEMDVSDMAAELSALGVPDDLARDVWEVARANITKARRGRRVVALFRDGATPLVEDEDRDFVARPSRCCPSRPTARTPGATGPAR
jgi:glutamyl-tRNA synthetase